MPTKQEIYDKISKSLTDYEDAPPFNSNEEMGLQIEEFYDLLVEIQNNWEGVITADEV